ncbi:MAG: class I SAM-dependent RNA methyltransferase [Anaerolineaceae bacterium]|nr:class I SAM-dependent RNA methyltransferase [Anaerolineaceae bacterium]
MDNEETICTLNIEKSVYGGLGLSHLEDGRVCFVPLTVAGDRVKVKLQEGKEKFAHAHLLEILSPSAQRVQAPCPHFGRCGGCHYQMLPYPDQLQLKSEILSEQMSRLAGLKELRSIPVIASSSPLGYRNQVQFHPMADGSLGLMALDGSQAIAIQNCLLPLPGIQQAWPLFDLGTNPPLNRVSFREDSRGEVLVLMEGPEPSAPDLETDLDISLAYKAKGSPSVLTLAGEDSLVYTIKGKDFLVSAESFFQVNVELAEKILDYIRDVLPEGKMDEVLELYSGAGLFSMFMAENCSHLTAIEASPSACYDFVDNLQAFDHVDLYEGAVEAILPELVKDLPPIDLVLLDPPRSGLHPKARQALLQLAPQHIIYVSCDPSSLARDLKAFNADGYQVKNIQGFDMFPQTYHIETVVLMSRVEK